MLDGFRKSSLVRRLVILAAGWSLTVLLVSALVLALLFRANSLKVPTPLRQNDDDQNTLD